jgi:hypothetical protein
MSNPFAEYISRNGTSFMTRSTYTLPLPQLLPKNKLRTDKFALSDAVLEVPPLIYPASGEPVKSRTSCTVSRCRL